MSQPVGIIVKIKIPESDYKNYLKTKEVKQLASSMFDSIKHTDRIFYIFQYTKKEQTLYVFIYYNYGNSETLKGIEFESLKSIQSFLTSESSGYLIGTLDCINLDQEDFHYAYTLEKGIWTDNKKLDDTRYKEVLKDTHWLYKLLDGEFSDKIFSSRIVDTTIVKIIRKLQEKHRIENLVNRLHEASPYKPLYFFGNYYYNGICIYNPYQRLTALSEIDPHTFIQKPYGGSDDKHVVIDNIVIATDPQKFKKLQKLESVFYTSSEAVYDYKGHFIPNADPKTFKLEQEGIAEDANYIYIFDTQIPKVEVGEYKIIDYGYSKPIIIYGKKSIYLNSNKLEQINPPTFEILEIYERSHNTFTYLIKAKDKDGVFIIYQKSGLNASHLNTPIEILRDIDIEQTIIEYQKTSHNLNEKKTSEEKLIDEIEGDDFIEQYNKNKHSLDFLLKINNYFYQNFQKWIKSKDKAELDKILKTYHIIKDTAWVNPHLFHHTACVYAALGEKQKATEEIYKACLFGYEEIKAIWVDEDLVILHSDPYYKELQQYYETNIKILPTPLITTEVLIRLDALSVEEIQSLAYTITKRFLIPDKSHVLLMQKSNNPNDQSWEVYLSLLQSLFNRVFKNSTFSSSLYKKFKDYELMPASGHFEQLKYQFSHAHIAGPTLEDCCRTLEKVRTSIDRIQNVQEKTAITNYINQSEIMKVLGEQV